MKLTLFSDPGKPPLPRSRMAVVLLGWALLVPALCYAVLGDAPLYMIMTVIGVTLAAIVPTSFRVTARAHIYSVVVSLVLAVFTNLLYKVDVEHFFLPVDTFFPFLIFLGIAYCFLDQRPAIVTISLACGVTALLLQGSSLSPPKLVRFPFDSPIFHQRFTIFSLCVIAQSYSILQLHKYAVHAKTDGRREGIRSHLQRIGITTAATVALFALTVGAAHASRIVYYRLDAVFSPIYRSRLEKKSAFATKITLNATVGLKSLKGVALFIDSPRAPGYLRGRIYQTYNRGLWLSSEASEPVELERGKGSIASSIYDPGPVPLEQLVKMDILPAPRFGPNVLYMPGNAQAIELIAARLNTNKDRMFTAGSWDMPTGYRLYCPKIDQSSAPQRPIEPGDEYLQLPVPADASIYAISESIVEGVDDDWDKVRRIVDYLHDSYSYDLSATPKSEKDPVLAFLEDTKKGHCELFATSAVLLLRAQKIKARYVTGFVTFESNGSGNYVARYSNCHAWPEVWLKDRGWFIIEPTPASSDDVKASFFRRAGERIQVWVLWSLAMMKRGYFAEAIIGFAKGVWGMLRWLFVVGPWFISWPIVIALVAYYIRRRRRREPGSGRFAAPEYEEIRKVLIRIISGMDIDYNPSMSLREVAVAIYESGGDSDGELGRLLRDYEALRYAPEADKQAAQSFLTRMRNWGK